ncbi:Trehalose utilization [Caulifigura coniformis]|uniref:Trehalose utilization n=1 Tax=Caulifigura coniformis TaxID=2527983 RepID=A0A517SE30_9PLAN|nr:ThuA domain-containing protein [Caulifigura coniformis]QDT54367.1 Trehalose utilization [Caulifigura coniformis]
MLVRFLLALGFAFASFGVADEGQAAGPKKIVIVAGEKSHGPEGNRIHDYAWTARLLKASLEASNVKDAVRVVYVRDGWPKDSAVLADADSILVVSDGRDGDKYSEAPHLESPERVAEVQKLIDRGCGLCVLHFSTFAPDKYATQVLDWTGGYFDWEENGERKWYSAIKTLEADVIPVGGKHAALSGLRPWKMKEEFYFNLRFAEGASSNPAGTTYVSGVPTRTHADGSSTQTLLVVPATEGRDDWGITVAWARERKNGGRGFGTTCGHFYDNWSHDDFRKLVLNALVWSAHADVPPKGVDGPFLSRAAIMSAIGEPFDPKAAGEESPASEKKTTQSRSENEPALAATRQGSASAPIRLISQKSDVPPVDDAPIRVLMFAGNDAHKWHNWEKTTPVIKKLLEIDPRITVDVSNNIEDLATKLAPGPDEKRSYDVVIQNYVNWHDNTPLSAASKSAFVDFIDNGGGLILVHFANGAFHFSLPEAGGSDWPEYRKIVRRVWNHDGPESKRSAHDPFKPMSVRPSKLKHEITKGLASFKLTDELYFSQAGEEPIEPLITAKSAITKRDEPLAWAYDFGQGRVFQTLLGHSEQTYDAFEAREMLRRAVAWSARRKVIPTPVDKDTSVAKKKVNHWGTDQVGFDWSEADSEDDRWKNSEIGNFLASIVPFNTNAIGKDIKDSQLAEKGLTIKVGGKDDGAVCYDTGRGQMRAAWTGGFLKFHPRRYGIIEAPHPDGVPLFTSSKHPGFTGAEAKPAEFHYRGLWRTGDRTVLNWEVNGTTVLETPWLQQVDGVPVLTRTFRVEAGDQPVSVALLKDGPNYGVLKVGDHRVLQSREAGQSPAFAIEERPGVSLSHPGDFRSLTLDFAPRTQPVEVTLLTWLSTVDKDQAGETVPSAVPAAASVDLTTFKNPGPSQWTAPLVTKGVRGVESGSFAVDTVTIPFENPYQAMFFVTGHDFLTPDVAAICTVHGDVWLVSGLAGDWSELKWKRYATGMFQPLGLVVRKRLSPPPAEAANAKESLTSPFDILVLCRDHIARLHDLNADDEADYYEVFNEEVTTSPGGHDYVTCLEQDRTGSLYYIHALEGIIRVSPDGRYKEVIGTGYRNPNGLGVSPDGDITVAPQEGNWTPSSGVFEVHPGSYGGFGGPKVQSGRPLGYDPPLCWIPRRLDNSSGGQVTVTSDKWGPLEGKLLHLSYGQCTVHLVLREDIHGVGQGGTIKLSPQFESGVCRGRFSPFDGQLYVSGLRGWTTSATQDGCFQRMRYTGRPVHLPVGVGTLKNGLTLTFSDTLDRESAEDPDNYFAEQWNVTYRAEYGSPEFKISNPKEEGRDPVDIESATLLEDGRTVFLEIPDIQPVSQLSLSYTLTAKDGAKIDQTYVHTIHLVRDAPFDPAKITRRAPKGQLSAEEEQSLKPGFYWQFSNGTEGAEKVISQRPSRMASLSVPDGQSPSSAFLAARPGAEKLGPYLASGTGFLHLPLKTAARFELIGVGSAGLEVNGQEVIPVSPLDGQSGAQVALHKGYNRIRVTYRSPSEGGSMVRLLWAPEGQVVESLPPEALFYSGSAETWWDEMVRRPRVMIDSLHCRNCHSGIEPATIPLRGAPSLENAGGRLQASWIAAWILDPKAHRKDATMPAMLGGFEQQADRQQAARDVAAWLSSLGGRSANGSSAAADEASHRRGRQLFEDLGCIVCHRLTPNADEDEWNRQSLTEVAYKFQPGQLERFISEPHRHFPTSYMADFRLTAKEAGDLSGFLIAESLKNPVEGLEPAGEAQADKKRGRELFGSLGCRQCHTAEAGDQLATERIDLKDEAGGLVVHLPARGCLGDDPADWRNRTSRLPIPDFGFTEEQAERIATVWCMQEKPSAAETSKRLMKAMHCQACHDRDGVKSARMQIIAEESETGIVPESLPALTWTGERLQTGWMEDFIAGRVKAKPREWLKARMPAFPAYAGAIAQGIAAEHGLAPTRPEAMKANAELAAAGKELLGSAGLDCRQCHGLGDAPPTGDKNTLLAPGINFTLVKDRIQPGFYHRWMLDPPRYDANTRMPKLAPDGKTTKVTKYFDGDAKKQFEAIWEYLQTP